MNVFQVAAFVFSFTTFAGIVPTPLDTECVQDIAPIKDTTSLTSETIHTQKGNFIACVMDQNIRPDKCTVCCFSCLEGRDGNYSQKMYALKACGCAHQCGETDGCSFKTCGIFCWRCVKDTENGDIEVGPCGVLYGGSKSSSSYFKCILFRWDIPPERTEEMSVCNVSCCKSDLDQCGPAGCLRYCSRQQCSACCGSIKTFDSQEGFFYKIARFFKANDEPTCCCCGCLYVYENGCNVTCIPCGDWEDQTTVAPKPHSTDWHK